VVVVVVLLTPLQSFPFLLSDNGAYLKLNDSTAHGAYGSTYATSIIGNRSIAFAKAAIAKQVKNT